MKIWPNRDPFQEQGFGSLRKRDIANIYLSTFDPEKPDAVQKFAFLSDRINWGMVEKTDLEVEPGGNNLYEFATEEAIDIYDPNGLYPISPVNPKPINICIVWEYGFPWAILPVISPPAPFQNLRIAAIRRLIFLKDYGTQ